MKPYFKLLNTRTQISDYVTNTQNILINSCYVMGVKEFSNKLKSNLIKLENEESCHGLVLSAAVISVINKTLDEMGVE